MHLDHPPAPQCFLLLLFCITSIFMLNNSAHAGQVQYQTAQQHSALLQTEKPAHPQYRFQLQEQIEEPLATIALAVSSKNAKNILDALHYQWTPLHWDKQTLNAKLTLPLSQAKDLMPHLLHNNKLHNVTLNANQAGMTQKIQQAKQNLALKAQRVIDRWNNKSINQQLLLRSINYQTHHVGTLIQIQADINADIIYHADTIPDNIIFLDTKK